MATAAPAQPPGSPEALEPDLGLACDFALRWAPETFPFITIASILPGGAPRVHTWHAQQHQQHLRRWLASRSGRENLYFTVNAPAKETLKTIFDTAGRKELDYHALTHAAGGLSATGERVRRR